MTCFIEVNNIFPSDAHTAYFSSIFSLFKKNNCVFRWIKSEVLINITNLSRIEVLFMLLQLIALLNEIVFLNRPSNHLTEKKLLLYELFLAWRCSTLQVLRADFLSFQICVFAMASPQSPFSTLCSRCPQINNIVAFSLQLHLLRNFLIQKVVIISLVVDSGEFEPIKIVPECIPIRIFSLSHGICLIWNFPTFLSKCKAIDAISPACLFPFLSGSPLATMYASPMVSTL